MANLTAFSKLKDNETWITTWRKAEQACDLASQRHEAIDPRKATKATCPTNAIVPEANLKEDSIYPDQPKGNTTETKLSKQYTALHIKLTDPGLKTNCINRTKIAQVPKKT